ncbi:MAG: hypothetical protein K6G11_00155 [Lachnospiraceae bacterium]|nr:hypothetical protein [Lachnospiraceae bacterium]
MWCPKCKSEYREGITECKSCGVALVENEPIEMLELCAFNEKEITERVYENLKDSELDDVRMEDNEDGTFSIYVPKTQQRKATKLFEAIMEAITDEEYEKRKNQAAGKSKKKSSNKSEEDQYDDADEDDEDEDEEQASYDWDAEDKKDIDSILEDESFEEEAGRFVTDEDDDPSAIVYEASTKYDTMEDKYKDYKFSGITFIIFGILGGVYLTLSKMQIIPIQYNIVVFCFICALFVGFLGVGIKSIISSSKYKELIPEEQEQMRVVNAWLKENVTEEVIGEWTNKDVDEAENDLFIMSHIRAALAREFEDYNRGLLDMLAEEFYENLYDDSEEYEESDEEENSEESEEADDSGQ